MSQDDLLNFCNQYLISKILTNPITHLARNKIKSTTPKKPKFEKHTHKKPHPPKDKTPQKVRRKKFQGAKTSKIIAKDLEENLQLSPRQDGYVPIEVLLKGLEINKTNNRNKPVEAWTTSQINFFPLPKTERSNYYHSPAKHMDLSPNCVSKNLYSAYSSQLIYESPPSNLGRQNSRLPLVTHNLEPCPSERTLSGRKDRTISTSRKQRSFYMPNSNHINRSFTDLKTPPQIKKPSLLSSNSMIAKFDREIKEKEKYQEGETLTEKEEASETRFETKPNKKQDSDDFGSLNLDLRLRSELTYLSESRVPPKPIDVRIK